mmetsp:Transcript_79796/g.258114  ORF Transcript_79796/g.258114 Transcript_79796/m.258114 type:complete len:85 (+) Transcript_79796:68-322(+)
MPPSRQRLPGYWQGSFWSSTLASWGRFRSSRKLDMRLSCLLWAEASACGFQVLEDHRHRGLIGLELVVVEAFTTLPRQEAKGKF